MDNSVKIPCFSQNACLLIDFKGVSGRYQVDIVLPCSYIQKVKEMHPIQLRGYEFIRV